jgi:hypothetical protein
MKRIAISFVLMCSCLVGLGEPATKPTGEGVKPVADGVWGVKEGAPSVAQVIIEAQREWRAQHMKGIRESISLNGRELRKTALSAERRKTIRDQNQKLQTELREFIAEDQFLMPRQGVYGMLEDGWGLMVSADVVQVVDKNNAIVADGSGRKAWLTSVDTSGVVDHELWMFEKPIPMTVGPTKTYPTASGGSETVRTFQPFDLSNIVRIKKN